MQAPSSPVARPLSCPHSSSWPVVVSDSWLASGFNNIPEDGLLQPRHVAGATMYGSAISDACTQGVYPAELQAIVRALAMFPLTASLHIHTDSEASVKAIRSYMNQVNERKRLRMSGRPLLQLIHHLITLRDTHATTQLSHVKAHTDGDDIHSVGIG